MADEFLIRAGLPEAGDRAVDQARVADVENILIDAEALGDARAELLDDDVGALREPQINFLARAALEIERRSISCCAPARWRARRRGPRRADVAGAPACSARRPVGAPGSSTLDDFGAEIAEDHRAMRPGASLVRSRILIPLSGAAAAIFDTPWLRSRS